MAVLDLIEYLREKSYPGRGVLLGLAPGGESARVAYFIMGRSDNSRNRVFTQNGSELRTEPADPSRVEDPSLILYTPVRQLGRDTVVTNGDQTDTICEALAAGGRFEDALRRRSFEPDAPNYTPRISGLLRRSEAGFAYRLSILKAGENGPQTVRRFFYEYENPAPGEAHLIHTYADNREPLPPFAGEPLRVGLPDAQLCDWGEALWAALDAENKVSLMVRSLARDGGEETIVYNRFQKR